MCILLAHSFFQKSEIHIFRHKVRNYCIIIQTNHWLFWGYSLVSFVFFVSRVSCYFWDERDKRDDRDGSEVGHQSALSLPCAPHSRIDKCCPRLRFCLSRLFRLSGLLRFWDERDKRDDRDGSEVGYQSALTQPCAQHCHIDKCCPRLRFCLSRLFRLSGLLLFWDKRDKRDDRDGSEVGHQSALTLPCAPHCHADK